MEASPSPDCRSLFVAHPPPLSFGAHGRRLQPSRPPPRRPRRSNRVFLAAGSSGPQEVWARVKTAIPLSTAFADYLGPDALTSTGPHKYKVVCPFHNDKNPSLHIDDTRGTFHCFACTAGGTIIDFQQLRGGHRSVSHALKDLAAAYPPIASVLRTAAFTTPTDSPQPQQHLPTPLSIPVVPRRVIVTHKAIAHEILREADILYQRTLWDPHFPPALNYLIHQRRLSEPTIRAFGCGFAPPSPTADFLLSHLTSLSYPENHAVIAGVARNPREQTVLDVLRNRVITPIRDISGTVRSFAGRVLPDAPPEAPKYVNGPETVLFKKSELLFGSDLANRAPSAKSDRGYVVVVEGYMDVMTMFDSTQGRVACVATMGTATSVAQLNAAYDLLSDVADGKIIINFDADHAGVTALLRMCEKVIPKSQCPHAVYIAMPPPPIKDPDEFLRLVGKADEYVSYLLGTALPWYEWQGDRIVRAEIARMLEIEKGGDETLLGEKYSIDRQALSLVESNEKNFDFVLADFLRQQRDDLLVAYGAPQNGSKYPPGAQRKRAKCSHETLEELAKIIACAHQCLPGLNVSALAQSWTDTLSRGRPKALFSMYATLVKLCEELSKPWRELSVPVQVHWMPPPPWIVKELPRKKRRAMQKALMRGESEDSVLDQYSDPKYYRRTVEKIKFQEAHVMPGLRGRQSERAKLLKLAPRRAAEEIILQTLIFASEIDRLDGMEKLLEVMIRCRERNLPFWTSKERESLYMYLFKVEGPSSPDEIAAYAEDSDWWNKEIEELFLPIEDEKDPEWQTVRQLSIAHPVAVVESTASSIETMAGKVASFIALEESGDTMEKLVKAASAAKSGEADDDSAEKEAANVKELLAKQISLKKDVDRTRYLSPGELSERDEDFKKMMLDIEEQQRKDDLLSGLEAEIMSGDVEMPPRDLPVRD